MNQRFKVLQELGEQFERAALNDTHSHEVKRRLSAAGLELYIRGWRLWSLVGAAGVALVAGVVTAVVLLSAGTPAAYAGWAPVPTTVTPSELTMAVNKCYKTGTNNNLELPIPGGSQQPTLAEARGHSAAAIYVIDSQVYMCLYEHGSVYTSVNSDSMGGLRAAPGPDQLSIPYGLDGGSGNSTRNQPLSAAQRQQLRKEMQNPAYRDRRLVALRDTDSYVALGQAGSDVSAVSFAFANGKTVTASVQNGWYFAWWPWTSDPTSVTTTTTSGTTTSPMKDTWPGGEGSRPYPACQPDTTGCVFASKQPIVTPTTTTTSTDTTTAPPVTTPAESAVETATQDCDAFSLSMGSVPGDAFAGTPALTDVNGIYTALLNIVNGRAYGCLIGGNQKDIHAFFMEDLASFGPVRAAPGSDQISVPDARRGGGGSGRPDPSLRPNRNATPAQQVARLERLTGGGYGPYTLGQAGSNVSAVTFTFANGKSTSAVVENGWYFAWWPWISTPTSVTITTSSGTATSPVTGSQDDREPIAPGCQPGAGGCVFVKTAPASPVASTGTTTTSTNPTNTATSTNPTTTANTATTTTGTTTSGDGS